MKLGPSEINKKQEYCQNENSETYSF